MAIKAPSNFSEMMNGLFNAIVYLIKILRGRSLNGTHSLVSWYQTLNNATSCLVGIWHLILLKGIENLKFKMWIVQFLFFAYLQKLFYSPLWV